MRNVTTRVGPLVHVFAFPIVSICITALAVGAEFYVAPRASVEGDGSKENPWDLATALEHPDSVKPGDTIWLCEGEYRGSFKSRLEGEKDTPIVVRQKSGERAVVHLQPTEGVGGIAFYMYGQWTRFQGFEITCTNLKRTTSSKGSWPPDLRRGSVECRGSNIELVNLIIHDLGNAVGFWSSGSGGTFYGCLVYNNGWRAPDRAHGHGIYTQNEHGEKRIIDNIFFNQCRNGINLYGSTKARLKGFHIEGNIAFNNGSLAGEGSRARNILIGGEAPLEAILMRQNYSWDGGIQIGYPWGKLNNNVAVEDNYFVGHVALYNQSQLSFQRNYIVADGPLIRLTASDEDALRGHRLDGNKYFRLEGKHAPFALSVAGKSSSRTLGQWRKHASDLRSQFNTGSPQETQVFVRPNRYEEGRAHIVVYNWQQLELVQVDLSDVLRRGQRFRIVNAQQFFGAPVVDGEYDGKPVLISMKPINPASPVGLPDFEPPRTEPKFGVFVVLPD